MTSNAGGLNNESRTILEWQRRIANGERFSKLDIAEIRKFGMWLFELERIEHANNPHVILAGFAILKKELGVALHGIGRALGVNVEPILADWRSWPAWMEMEAAALAGGQLNTTPANGKTPGELATMLGLSARTVNDYARKLRIATPGRGGHHTLYAIGDCLAIARHSVTTATLNTEAGARRCQVTQAAIAELQSMTRK